MKAIALNELASVEQYGTEQVFYESVNLGGVFERIKAFFKKIIEKIHKILHTFISKMSSWFQSSKDFAKKYEKEIIKNWGLVKNDWEIKGYKFAKILTKSMSETQEQTISGEKNDAVINTLKASTNAAEFTNALKDWATDTSTTKESGNDQYTFYSDSNGKKYIYAKKDCKHSGKSLDAGKYYEFNNNKPGNEFSGDPKSLTQNVTKSGSNSYDDRNIGTKEDISKFREEFNEKGKDQIRYQIVNEFKDNNNIIINKINCNFDSQGSYDAKEFTDELHKVIYGEDGDKEDINKSDIEKMYGGSITSMMTFLKDYDKIKDNIEKAERNLIKTIDNRIKAIDTAQNTLIKDKDTSHAEANENIIQISTVFQSFWGFIKECETQVFSTYLQGLKDACSQAKQIAVAVIGLNKKMTESYDYSNSYYSDNSFNSFIENVKLV